MLENIRIVMVNTSHPGNIGAAARALKTMGLRRLVLVAPPLDREGKAKAMAAGGEDVLLAAQRVDTLDAAIADCGLVIGTSARLRRIPWPHLPAAKAASLALAQSAGAQVAILFGNEQSGLSNDELQRCHAHLEIPGDPEYPVLNVAAAVQVVCYELRQQWLAQQQQTGRDDGPRMPVELVRWDDVPANHEHMEQFFAHCEETLLETGFFEAETPKKLMARVRRLFLRARPDERELRMLRGMLASAQQAARRGTAPSRRGE